MTPITTMSNNDAALEAIRAALGASASVLQHLPSDKVRLKSFVNKGDRHNTLPIRMLFGQIKEGQDKDKTRTTLYGYCYSTNTLLTAHPVTSSISSIASTISQGRLM